MTLHPPPYALRPPLFHCLKSKSLVWWNYVILLITKAGLRISCRRVGWLGGQLISPRCPTYPLYVFLWHADIILSSRSTANAFGSTWSRWFSCGVWPCRAAPRPAREKGEARTRSNNTPLCADWIGNVRPQRPAFQPYKQPLRLMIFVKWIVFPEPYPGNRQIY